MERMLKPLVFVMLIFLPQMSWSWTTLNHQMLYEISAKLASNDGGDEFKAAKIVLDRNQGTMIKAVIAPDVNKKLWPPILLHANEAMMHYNFLGPSSEGSQKVAGEYYTKAVKKWQEGDMGGALFDLGCVLHLVQDAGFSGHSNSLFFTHLGKHSAFENWVERETAPKKHPKSFEELWADGWVIKSGGAYLKSSWRDDQRRPHWEGNGEAWIDVAAHLSYELAQCSMGLDYDGCDFQGVARMQFVSAERCGAGLLVDFFRRVGVMPDLKTLALEARQSGLYPVTSANGVSRLLLRQNGGGSYLEIHANKTPRPWEFPDNNCLSAPRRVGRAFYLNNYFVGLTDAAEGDDWSYLFLLPAVPEPDSWYSCPEDNPEMHFFFNSRELSKYHFQVVTLS